MEIPNHDATPSTLRHHRGKQNNQLETTPTKCWLNIFIIIKPHIYRVWEGTQVVDARKHSTSLEHNIISARYESEILSAPQTEFFAFFISV